MECLGHFRNCSYFFLSNMKQVKCTQVLQPLKENNTILDYFSSLRCTLKKAKELTWDKEWNLWVIINNQPSSNMGKQNLSFYRVMSSVPSFVPIPWNLLVEQINVEWLLSNPKLPQICFRGVVQYKEEQLFAFQVYLAQFIVWHMF